MLWIITGKRFQAGVMTARLAGLLKAYKGCWTSSEVKIIRLRKLKFVE